jgi:hypothetical protein
MELSTYPHRLSSSITEVIPLKRIPIVQHTTQPGGTMNTITERAIRTELQFRNALVKAHDSFFARLKDDRGDVPGWVLVVLMTTGLVTALWTIAAPRLSAILRNSLDSMNGIR